MKTFCLTTLLVMGMAVTANANLLINGNLDSTYDQEIVPGFFLPKPTIWANEGFRSIAGAYEDEMSSEPWAGPAPTPATADDKGVFFKAFTGNPATVGLATGHLYQTVDGFAGVTYQLTGWAGGEANVLMRNAVFALDFVGAAGIISSVELSLLPTLVTPNGQPFNYKQYTVTGVAPTGTIGVRARASMIDGQSNPLGGGQAFVVDDFELNAVPEPATMAVLGMGALAVLRRRNKKA